MIDLLREIRIPRTKVNKVREHIEEIVILVNKHRSRFNKSTYEYSTTFSFRDMKFKGWIPESKFPVKFSIVISEYLDLCSIYDHQNCRMWRGSCRRGRQRIAEILQESEILTIKRGTPYKR